MISRLVLVRHAKTETRKSGKDDLARVLTKSGMRSIEARFPYAACLLADVDESELHVWSSPALRAVQTAAVLAECLDTDGIEVHESLYAVEFGDFLAELGDASGTVVAVGHNPFMEELHEHLSRQFQHYEKGALASFLFEESPAGEHSRAGAGASALVSLEWFVQGPEHARWKTLVQMEKALARAGENIQMRYEALLDAPGDAEALHQYRISLRVARSLVKFVRPYQRKQANRELSALLKKLQAPTSRVRELDMLVAGLPQAPELRGPCIAEQERVRREFNGLVSKGKTRRALRKAVRLLQHVEWRDAVEVRGLGREQLAFCVEADARAFSQGIDEVDFADTEAVHDLRKRAKALRYVTRELAEALPQGSERLSASMKGVQDMLGTMLDARANARLVRELCGPEDDGLAASFDAQADMIVSELNRMHERP